MYRYWFSLVLVRVYLKYVNGGAEVLWAQLQQGGHSGQEANQHGGGLGCVVQQGQPQLQPILVKQGDILWVLVQVPVSMIKD